MERFRNFLRRFSLPTHLEPATSKAAADQDSAATDDTAAVDGDVTRTVPLVSFYSRQELIDYVRQNLTRDEIQQLLDSTRPEPITDRLAGQILNRTRAMEQISIAHELVYGLGKYIM